MLKYLEECNNKIHSISDTSNFFEIFTASLTQYPDFDLYVLKNDSLVFWSNYSIPVSDIIYPKNFTQGVGFFSNGHYLLESCDVNNYSLIVTYLIKSEYQYENQYLKNEFNKDLTISNDITISYTEAEHNIFGANGEFLFSLTFPKIFAFDKNGQFVLILFFVLAYIFLHALLYNIYNIISARYTLKWPFLIAFIIDVLIIRIFIFYLRYPYHIFNSILFDPDIFASSWYLPSLGDLLLSLLSLFSVSIAIFKFFKFRKNPISELKLQNIISEGFSLLFVLFLFNGLTHLIKILVLNSSINFNLNYISEIDTLSIIGFFCIGLLISSFIFLTLKPLLNFVRLFSGIRNYFISSTVFILVVVFLNYILFQNIPYHYLFLLLYFLSFWNLNRASNQDRRIQFSFSILQILLFAAFSTYLLFVFTSQKEKENRILYAQNLSEQQDPLVEYKFSIIQSAIFSDTVLSNNLNSIKSRYELPDSDPQNYILKKYFTDGFNDYDIVITICDQDFNLELQPEDINVNCFEYFDSVVKDFSKHTGTENLYITDYGYIKGNYLGILDFRSYSFDAQIFIELYSKNIPKGLGYPELLIDNKTTDRSIWTNYSFAFYNNAELVYRNGNFFYSTKLPEQEDLRGDISFVNFDKYNHLFYHVDDDVTLVIGYKNAGFLDIAAPFSYISIFYGLFTFFLLLFINTPFKINLRELNLKKRIQFSIITLILTSFIFIGVSSVYYIISLNKEKNNSILSEKAHSVIIELEHKLADEQNLTSDMELYLSDLLYKFSLVFFSDINLYNPEGTLLASSRPEIFNKGLLSEKMNPVAFQNLSFNNKSLFIHEEKIADYSFLSAYLPFINADNKLIGYLNLPYFAKQEELTKEVSNFLTAFINIYVILIAISIYIALIISNYITKPLQLLREKISQLKLGKTEEKISWSKKDEIGSLVVEYNRMVDELATSATLLAKSERESAWREMAKQIAHEIKNPLTPMKLSVQYLQKAYDEKAPDWDKRLKRFTQTIVEQIDSLSIIASEFSDFAKMPKSKFDKTDINEVIKNVIGLFKNTSRIHFKFHYTEKHYVHADKEQLLRVFNNLIKNSIQAISDPGKGVIEISIEKSYPFHIIKFFDNGD
ncbi:MAG: hypothetical protein K8S16_01175 [Bacteroidales bacterium]|nr:hypothetical protein [Bacteroidales bacterium]